MSDSSAPRFWTRRPEWFDRALCRGMDPALFFPDVHEGNDVAIAAKRICDACPVQTECLRYAIANRVEGVWGGSSPKDRRRMRRTGELTVPAPKRQKSLCGTNDGYWRHRSRDETVCTACMYARQQYALKAAQ